MPSNSLDEFDWSSLPRGRLLVFVHVKDETGTYGSLRGYFEKVSGSFVIVRRPLGDLVYLDTKMIRRIEVTSA